MTTIGTTRDIESLRARLTGAVVEPGDAGWKAATQAFNLSVEQRPALVALPAHEGDVAAVVAFARANGLRVAPQRTGHNAAPLGTLESSVLLRTDPMQGVTIDERARKARVRAGAKWENVVPRASELGLAALHGSTPDAGVVGYTLGGGVGWYARKLGLAANSVTAIEVVTADGTVVRADHDHEPELFWALRGGGGNFGVVTAMEFDLYPISQVYAGALFFPWERSAEVLHAWLEWVATTPDEVTSVGRILQFPPDPAVPEPLRAKSFALVEAVYVGDEEDGADLLRPLRALGPALDTFAMVPPVGISELHMDPPEPVPYVTDHQLLGSLPARAIDDLIAAAGPESGSRLLNVELRQLGGALSRGAPSHGALSMIPGAFISFGVGLASDYEATAASEAQLAVVAEALAPYDIGRYFNFTEVAVPVKRFFTEETYARLAAVKAQYDPEHVFHANHAIGSQS